MKQISRETAIKIAESGLWEDWSDEEKVRFQLYQSRLAMPWGEFRGAVERVLGRDVWTHEYASGNVEALRAEYESKQPTPTFEDIVNLIPADNLVIIEIQ